MHRTKFVMSLLAGAGLVLAGCSTGDDDDATSPQASTGSGTAESAAPDETSADADDDAEASGDLVAWAADFCGAIAPLEQQFNELESDFTPDPSGTADPLAGVEVFAQLGPAFEAAADAIEEVGAPPIDGGDEVYTNMVTVLGTASEVFGQVEEQLAELDPNDPAALETLTPLFTEIGAEFEAAGAEIEAAFDQPEMKAAFDTAPECEGLDIGE